MAPRISQAIRQSCVDLRIKERLSVKALAKRLSLSASSVSAIVKPFPLTTEEKVSRMEANGRKSGGLLRQYDRKPESEHHQKFKISSFPKMQKAKIAEAAAIFRLLLIGASIYKSVFDGDKYDLIVEVDGTLLKIQVKSVLDTKPSPSISLRCSQGRGKFRKYKPEEYDYIIGYDLFSDTAYVWSYAETSDLNSSVTISAQAEDAFHKLKIKK